MEFSLGTEMTTGPVQRSRQTRGGSLEKAETASWEMTTMIPSKLSNTENKVLSVGSRGNEAIGYREPFEADT